MQPGSLAALNKALKLKEAGSYALSNVGWAFMPKKAHEDMVRQATALIGSQDFKSGIKEVQTILEELAPDSTLLGRQSAAALVSGVPEPLSIRRAIDSLKKGDVLQDAVAITMRAAMQPAASSVLDPAVQLAIALSKEDGTTADPDMARRWPARLAPCWLLQCRLEALTMSWRQR